MSGRSKNKIDPNRPKAGPEDRKKYIDAWSKMMLDIWEEKIIRLNAIDTTNLYESLDENALTGNDDAFTVVHKFAEYGIYVDVGTGWEFRKNRGYIGNNAQPTQQPKEWFSRSYYASVMKLKEQMVYMYGEEFIGLITDAISQSENKRSKSLRSALWGSRKS